MASADETLECHLLVSAPPPDGAETAGPPAAAKRAGAGAAPDRVGGFRIVEPLDSGGFGEVFRAEPVAGGAPAAIKILHKELVVSPSALARFEREVLAIRCVRHPGVVTVLEAGKLDDGRPYFVMELLSGVSLQRRLAARGRLSVAEALAILAPLCDALAAAHAAGVVHRDVKASNVFLCDGPERRVVLLDFGVAKLLHAEGPGLTASRQIVGTVACMAPEQILSGAVDERTDVYALGALAYRMLTGALPFEARSLMLLQQMHLYAAPRPPSAVAPVAPALDGPILRALAKDPDDRQPGPRELLAEIEAAARLPGAGAQGAIVVHVEARIDQGALEDPDEALLADLEGVLGAAVSELEAAGLRVAQESGTAALLARARPEDPVEERSLRRGLAGALAALAGDLAARPGCDPRVRPRLCLHAGEAALGADGALIGGDLLRLGWVPDIDAAGPLVSAEAAEGLDDLGARPAGAWGETSWIELPPGGRARALLSDNRRR
ncbi:MAG: serine/threonine protein kinase [Polyangiaceae bacterium]|nr:serine/threonine protein kinase [Polyangiaceae bacterium]